MQIDFLNKAQRAPLKKMKKKRKIFAQLFSIYYIMSDIKEKTSYH